MDPEVDEFVGGERESLFLLPSLASFFLGFGWSGSSSGYVPVREGGHAPSPHIYTFSSVQCLRCLIMRILDVLLVTPSRQPLLFF